MSVTLNDLVRAGAIPSLVNYFNAMGGRDSDWIQTAAFAYREFRNTDPVVIDALVRMAKAARLAAACQEGLQCGQRLDASHIPGI